VENTTAELLASWIGRRLQYEAPALSASGASTLQVEVEENFGQWAICEIDLRPQ
jgi:6-pyruvoyltetrahydropterin/6-carboxytetrahydropterin synthase